MTSIQHQRVSSLRRSMLRSLLLLNLTMACGCQLARHTPKTAELPERHEVRLGNLIVRSDVPLSKDEPLLTELEDLRAEIESTLELPHSNKPVIVHLFGNEQSYAAYMRHKYPGLPPRRAFFVGSPTDLTVYAFWGDNVEEDLRHEYTHGVLHASLKTVPLWLDEGLAEYFETRQSIGTRLHPQHTERLAQAVANGWKPDLSRLEKLEDVNQMQRADYQEAWAWIHYLLHEAPDGRGLLIDYCQSLATNTRPGSFAAQLKELFPDADRRLQNYIAIALRMP